ncbi:response regulator [Acuticoccus kandeliae]|uniref:response regulator n=1 Tax=Acuticoccus kandeliae TaxID=2073160 RepID=UPI000D3E7CBE|nr:response regulator transcription factor [Acuticoccus kandeliae]
MSSVPLVLVVDDDPEIRDLLSRYLVSQGFRVEVAGDQAECLATLAEKAPDLVVLDVMLPDGSGLDLCRDLSSRRPSTPVILLTALKEDVDRIIGLELGADDYLGKPFNPRELTARIRAVLRRSATVPEKDDKIVAYRVGDFVMEPERRRIARSSGEEVTLTSAEFDLLRTFMERPGRLLSRDQLLDLTQGRDRDAMDRSIDVLMSRLRRKLGDTSNGPLFKTIRNGGYQLAMPVQTEFAG